MSIGNPNKLLKMDKPSTEELLWKISSAVERLEHAILPTAYNGNNGLVTQVQDHEKRIDELETYRIKREEAELQMSITSKKRNDLILVIASVAGLIITGLGIYFATKK